VVSTKVEPEILLFSWSGTMEHVVTDKVQDILLKECISNVKASDFLTCWLIQVFASDVWLQTKQSRSLSTTRGAIFSAG
jgi:hypothetical protein